MYIYKAIYENVGPLNTVCIDFPFNENGTPKPAILVGENGSGKSTVLSNIVDALYEMAGKQFSNAQQRNDEGIGSQYYKIISGTEIHSGKPYMVSYLLFKGINEYRYLFKNGEVNNDSFTNKFGIKNGEVKLDRKENSKNVSISKENARDEWASNVFCYFGPDRYERPSWMGEKYYRIEEYSHPSVKKRWNGKLETPISATNVTASTLQWLLDIIADSRADIRRENNGTLSIEHIDINNLHLLRQARTNIETILSKIVGEQVYFALNFRSEAGSRFKILRQKDNSVFCPSLDSLSTGQAALFNMFATIIRYADGNDINKSIHMQDIQGIVIIDEVELHLHTTLQKEVLPELFKLFPKVQFIISSHAPLFLLGMNDSFGEDGFDVYELPDAEKISVERFSEFSRAYDYFKETQLYQAEIKSIIDRIPQSEKPLVITEGSTDWKHMETALRVLCAKAEYRDIFDNLCFDFLEYEPKNSSSTTTLQIEMGNEALIPLCESLIRIPHERKYIILADADTPKISRKLVDDGGKTKKWDNNTYSAILPIPENRKDTPEICIEHYYSDAEIETEIEINGIKRHLYMGKDFNSNGYNYSLDVFCERKDLCGPGKINILDGSQGERIRKLSDETDSTNYAISKSDFAEYVRSHADEFDFSNFIPLFEMIKSIVEGTTNA